MGKAYETVRLSDAAGGRAFGGVAVRSDLTSVLKGFCADESGATAIEYGLIVSCIFLAVVTAVSFFADSNTAMYAKITTAVANVR
jgi:pilus assembly protein Flp/PilA